MSSDETRMEGVEIVVDVGVAVIAGVGAGRGPHALTLNPASTAKMLATRITIPIRSTLCRGENLGLFLPIV
jgi:hypothetical protein